MKQLYYIRRYTLRRDGTLKAEGIPGIWKGHDQGVSLFEAQQGGSDYSRANNLHKCEAKRLLPKLITRLNEFYGHTNWGELRILPVDDYSKTYKLR